MRRMHAASRLAGVQRRLRGQVPQARGGVAAAAGQVAPVRAEAHRQHRVCVACGCARLDRLVPCHWPGCANGLQRRAGASAAAAWRGRYGWRMDSGCRGSCASRCRHARPSTPKGLQAADRTTRLGRARTCQRRGAARHWPHAEHGLRLVHDAQRGLHRQLRAGAENDINMQTMKGCNAPLTMQPAWRMWRTAARFAGMHESKEVRSRCYRCARRAHRFTSP